MIVAQGQAVAGNEEATYVQNIFLSLTDTVITRQSEFSYEDLSVTAVDRSRVNAPYFKTDASNVSAELNYTTFFPLEGLTDVAVSGAYAIGKKYRIGAPSSSVEGLSKREYMEYVLSFDSTSVDIREGTAVFRDQDGQLVFSECSITDFTEDDTCESYVRIEREAGLGKLIVDAGPLLNALRLDNDYAIIDKLMITASAVSSETGEVVELKLDFGNSGDALINGVKGVSSESGGFITMDSGLHMTSGWLDGLEIDYQLRSLVSTESSTTAALFRYAYFAIVAPGYFNSEYSNMMMCGEKIGSAYHLKKVFTNNSVFNNENPNAVVTAYGPNVSGTPTITVTESEFLFDTSNVTTDSGRVICGLAIDGMQANAFYFEMPCGAAAGDFVVSAVDSKIAYNTLLDSDILLEKKSQAADAGINSAITLIWGMQDPLTHYNYDTLILKMILTLAVPGLACSVGGNMIEFVFYLKYQRDLVALNEGVQREFNTGADAVVDRRTAVMTQCTVGVPMSMRRDISEQLLAPLELVSLRWYTVPMVMPFIWMCIPLTFRFTRSSAYRITAPNLGVPLANDFLDTAELELGVMTDDHKAMMKKNLSYNVYESFLNKVKFEDETDGTFWVQTGDTVVLKRNGRHQEFYAIDDEGYKIGDRLADDITPVYCQIEGEIGDEWNRVKRELVEFAPKLASVFARDGVFGTEAEDYIEQKAEYSTWTRFHVIDVDENKHTYDGVTTDVKLFRPNDNIIIALKEEV